jgi:hypothetical protein
MAPPVIILLTTRQKKARRRVSERLGISVSEAEKRLEAARWREARVIVEHEYAQLPKSFRSTVQALFSSLLGHNLPGANAGSSLPDDVMNVGAIQAFFEAAGINPLSIPALRFLHKANCETPGFLTLQEFSLALRAFKATKPSDLDATAMLRAVESDDAEWCLLWDFAWEFNKPTSSQRLPLSTANSILQLLVPHRVAARSGGVVWPMLVPLCEFFSAGAPNVLEDDAPSSAVIPSSAAAAHAALEGSATQVQEESAAALLASAGLTKDTWHMVSVFMTDPATKQDASFANYNFEGANAVLIDHFVRWYRKTRGL